MRWEIVNLRMEDGLIRYIDFSADNVFVELFIACLIIKMQNQLTPFVMLLVYFCV